MDDASILPNIFSCIATEFGRRYQIKDREATDPNILAFERAVHSLKCRVAGLLVRYPNRVRLWGTVESDLVSYIRFDFEKQGSMLERWNESRVYWLKCQRRINAVAAARTEAEISRTPFALQ